MRTPAGTDCIFFYGNYFRGRKQEECRLIGTAPPPHHWTPDICAKCPIPGILRANACENINYEAKVNRTLFGLIKRVEITAYCKKSAQFVTEPHIGCGQCHPLPTIFLQNKK